ncbi:MAG: hypothetical protein LBE76_03445 [Nitrososphaerota archaeon]|nr:hypothetical protein [Nitrososphaerota archaeon]
MKIGLETCLCLVPYGVTVILVYVSFQCKKRLSAIADRVGVCLLFLCV